MTVVVTRGQGSGVAQGPVLIAGANGRLGLEVVRRFAGREVIAHTRATLDVTDAAAVARVIAKAAPALVVNCTGFNDVDGAETRPLEALAVNAFAVRSLARAASAAGAVFVHYGSDFVFDGATDVPYTEEAVPAPQSTYSASKLLGEWFALEAPGAYVLRVESLFGLPDGWAGPRGTLDTIVDGLRAGRELRVFTDRIVTPSYMPDIAAATRHLVLAGAAPGLYHCVNDGPATWYEVASEAARLLRVEPRLVPTRSADMPMAARRPRYCALSGAKLARAGYVVPPWQDALRRWLLATPA